MAVPHAAHSAGHRPGELAVHALDPPDARPAVGGDVLTTHGERVPRAGLGLHADDQRRAVRRGGHVGESCLEVHCVLLVGLRPLYTGSGTCARQRRWRRVASPLRPASPPLHVPIVLRLPPPCTARRGPLPTAYRAPLCQCNRAPPRGPLSGPLRAPCAGPSRCTQWGLLVGVAIVPLSKFFPGTF